MEPFSEVSFVRTIVGSDNFASPLMENPDNRCIFVNAMLSSILSAILLVVSWCEGSLPNNITDFVFFFFSPLEAHKISFTFCLWKSPIMRGFIAWSFCERRGPAIKDVYRVVDTKGWYWTDSVAKIFDINIWIISVYCLERLMYCSRIIFFWCFP